MASWTQIFTRSKATSKEVFEQHMADSYRSAYHLAYRLSGNAADAEDLLQETYLRAYRFFHRYDPALPFQGWLFRIMTNVHIDLRRKAKRLWAVSLDAHEDSERSWEIADESGLADQAMSDNTLAEPLERALAEMNPDFRLAIWLADVEGLSYEEIAETMGTSVGTVRSRVHRGRKQLRNRMERMGVTSARGMM